MLAAGALGYGGSVVVQNAGISRTSVTHAALLIGAVPVLVAIIAAVWHRTVARPVAWFGFAVSLGGVALVTAGSGGGGATLAGDGLVLVSLLLSATVTVAQARLLTGRDPVAVTAVQFLGAALGALPVAVVTEGGPAAPAGAGRCWPWSRWRWPGRWRRSPCSRSARPGCPPRSPGRSSTSSRWSAPSRAPWCSATRSGSRRSAGGLAILAGIGLSSLPLLAGRRRPAARRWSRVRVLGPALEPTLGLALGPALGGAGAAWARELAWTWAPSASVQTCPGGRGLPHRSLSRRKPGSMVVAPNPIDSVERHDH